MLLSLAVCLFQGTKVYAREDDSTCARKSAERLTFTPIDDGRRLDY
jgi:hypothetical protein